MHDSAAGPYDKDEDPDSLFVERVEAIVCRENKEFYSRYVSKKVTAINEKIDDSAPSVR